MAAHRQQGQYLIGQPSQFLKPLPFPEQTSAAIAGRGKSCRRRRTHCAAAFLQLIDPLCLSFAPTGECRLPIAGIEGGTQAADFRPVFRDDPLVTARRLTQRRDFGL